MLNQILSFMVAIAVLALTYVAGYYKGEQKGQLQGYSICKEEISKDVVEVMANYIMFKESSFRHNVWGDLNLPHKVFGVAQFQRRTFYWMAGLAGLQNPNWKDQKQQVWLLHWALRNGYGSHWGKNYTRALRVAIKSVSARSVLRRHGTQISV